MQTSSSNSIFDLISPADLGLPPKFDRFRLPQRQALDWLNETCSNTLSAMCLPTGSGKTAIGLAFARFLGVKAVYLVATKALAQQVLSDGAPMGMVEIKGRANYTCPNYGDCDAGYEEGCSLHQSSGCAYSNAVNRAEQSSLVVSNYAYWLWSGGTSNRAFAGCGLLVCDEAHGIESQLGSFATVKIYARELGKAFHFEREGTMQPVAGGAYNNTAAHIWHDWATVKIREIDEHGENKSEDDEDLLDRCRRVSRMSPNWVWQFNDHGHVTFEPIRISGFTPRLFSGVPRVLLMSASLNEFTLKLLLSSDAAPAYDYRSWPQVFPPQNAPVYHIPTRKLNWKSTDEDYKAILETTDAIIDRRLDRKGIIHTVSYTRTQKALLHSRHASRFIWNKDSQNLGERLEQFRRAKPPVLFVSPSVPAGFDFPGEQCEYQIILKFPFPNETQRVIRERCKQIPGYRLWSAAQEIVQMCGRARRYEQDRCENFILDNSVRQLSGAEGRSYCPPGFRVFTVATIPPPPPKINSNSQEKE